jgi:hypothetical protein
MVVPYVYIRQRISTDCGVSPQVKLWLEDDDGRDNDDEKRRWFRPQRTTKGLKLTHNRVPSGLEWVSL